ncbi:hypothetical protein GCM10009414_21420 [Tatumella terrea]
MVRRHITGNEYFSPHFIGSVPAKQSVVIGWPGGTQEAAGDRPAAQQDDPAPMQDGILPALSHLSGTAGYSALSTIIRNRFTD